MKRKGSGDAAPLAQFSAICDAALGALLAAHGFSPAERRVTASFARQVYAYEPRYLDFSVSLDPRDAPLVCSVSVGEGGREWPERDWNAVALWRLVSDL